MDKVVITGIGIVSPVGLDKESTWENLLRGKTIKPYGNNLFFIDPNTSKKIFISVVLETEDKNN